MIEYTVQVYKDKTIWRLDGEIHREDDAAIIWADGTKSWYLNDKRLSEQEFLNRTKKVELTMAEIAEKFNVNINQLKIINTKQ